MKKVTFRRPTPAFVMAALALCVSASGTAVAFSVPRGSVGTAQLKDNAVTSEKVKNGSLRSADLRAGVLPVIAFAEVDSGDTSLANIPADQRAGIARFSHESGGFYCFDLTRVAKVGAATARYDGGTRFPRVDVPGSGLCPAGYQDASVVFASTSENSVDQGFSVIFYR